MKNLVDSDFEKPMPSRQIEPTTPCKNDWIYLYSNVLKMKIAFQETSRKVVCEDKVSYSMKEMDVLVNSGNVLNWQTHLVKKIFCGEIAEIRRYSNELY
jgi:hypothetical protein